jgi:hypothetical protein
MAKSVIFAHFASLKKGNILAGNSGIESKKLLRFIKKVANYKPPIVSGIVLCPGSVDNIFFLSLEKTVKKKNNEKTV